MIKHSIDPEKWYSPPEIVREKIFPSINTRRSILYLIDSDIANKGLLKPYVLTHPSSGRRSIRIQGKNIIEYIEKHSGK